MAANLTGVAFVYSRQNVTYRYENVTTVVDSVETREPALVEVRGSVCNRHYYKYHFISICTVCTYVCMYVLRY